MTLSLKIDSLILSYGSSLAGGTPDECGTSLAKEIKSVSSLVLTALAELEDRTEKDDFLLLTSEIFLQSLKLVEYFKAKLIYRQKFSAKSSVELEASSSGA